ncbi:TetR/AcrR family transcriptional regulator [Actinoplanes sp. HUAS TT8]|uniref:TetR/AcrR family transcriptional regulator n=1 Tax=Actinoplanes sp. HUAS TT8 TaxID=3447453 RepID=UPI003F5252AB
MTVGTSRRQRADGVRSRQAILETAVALATVEGLHSLSIARLAEHAGMSKSGLFAHFESKEALQLAIIEQAAMTYARDIVGPAMAEADPVTRLSALLENFLAHVAKGSLPGGCFFASSTVEFDTRPGPIRDRLAGLQQAWHESLTAAYADAQSAGQLDEAVDPAQAAFELDAYLLLANNLFVLFGDPVHLDRARRGIAAHLALHSQ